MRRAQDRARSARSRKNGARSATFKLRALGALKLASEASCAPSARWECAREAGRFFKLFLTHWFIIIIDSTKFFWLNLINTWNWLKLTKIFGQTNQILSSKDFFLNQWNNFVGPTKHFVSVITIKYHGWTNKNLVLINCYKLSAYRIEKSFLEKLIR